MVLQVKNLNKSFRHPWNLSQISVLKDVSFSIESRSIVGFLGGNGAGKTTTIKCLLGLLKYQSGQLKIFDQPHLSKSVKRDIGYLPERPYFYSYLTGEEFLTFYGQLSGLSASEVSQRIDELLELVGLTHAKKRFLKQYSKGMLQRIGMAQALIHRPRLLILDEPLSGLDPDGRRQLVSIIQNTYDQQKTSIFFSSHLLDDIDRLCQDLVVIKSGKVEFCGAKSSFVDQGDATFTIKFTAGSNLQTSSVSSVEELQKTIDRLRSDGNDILAVNREVRSLDRAFKEFHGQEVQR